MRPQRNALSRPRKRGLLIQCEGLKTEPNYLDDLCRNRNSSTEVYQLVRELLRP